MLGPQDVVESKNAHYWRASGRGLFFLVRAFPEDDAIRNKEPGTFLDTALPLLQTVDVLERAVRLARRFPEKVERIVLHVTWDGLAGRKLINWSRPTAIFPIRSEHRSRVPSVSNTLTVDVGKRDAPRELWNLLLPLYAAFDFDLREEDVSGELARREETETRAGS